MENLMGLNSSTYSLASSASSSYITLSTVDLNCSYITVTNITNSAVYVFSSPVSTETIAFPTTSGKGKVIPSGSVLSYKLNPRDAYMYCISQTADSGKYIYFSVGGGF